MTTHELLKSSTASVHNELEASLNLLRDDLTLQDYITILKRFYGFYSVVESHLEFLPLKQKTPHLISDLNYFGVEDLSNLPSFKSYPLCIDKSFEMGIRYVLEGSTLGGMILSRHFKEKFNLYDQGIAFFSGYGKETISYWKEFLLELEKFGQSKVYQENSLVDGALFTFSSLNDWLISHK